MLKPIIPTLFLSFLSTIAFSQEKDPKEEKINNLIQEISESTCMCVDSVYYNTNLNKSKEKINLKIQECFKSSSHAIVLGLQLLESSDQLLKETQKAIAQLGEVDKDTTISTNNTININISEQDVQDAYFQLERKLMYECDVLRDLLNTNDKTSKKSLSKNEKALELYSLGIKASAKEDFETAIKFYKEALEHDKKFAFCWDNLGVCYRRIGKYDEAISAYKASLKINPKGETPLQNICYAYLAKGDIENAINAYKEFGTIYPDNPEPYYGLANIYINSLKEYHKGLEYACQAYLYYVKINSAYKQDAITLIRLAYNGMKELNQEDAFDKILKKYNLE